MKIKLTPIIALLLVAIADAYVAILSIQRDNHIVALTMAGCCGFVISWVMALLIIGRQSSK